MSRDAGSDQLRRQEELVPRNDLRFAVLAWQTWAPRALGEKDLEIDALRAELRRVQAENLVLRRKLMRKPTRKEAVA